MPALNEYGVDINNPYPVLPFDPGSGGASGGGGDQPGAPPDPPYQPGPPITTGSGMTTQQFLDRIRNDPTYKFEYDRYFGPQGFYALQANTIKAGMGGGGGGYIPDYTKLRELATKQAGQQKAEASRDAEIQAAFNRERRASMGQGGTSSGTGAVEEDNDRKELDYLLSQIDIGLEQQLEQYNMSEKAARAAAAQAAAAAARATARGNAELALQQWYAQGKSFDILMSAADRVMDLTFDPQTGVYRGPNGFSITPQELSSALGSLQ